MSIKAVAFDYGNVLSLPQEEGAMSMLGVIADLSEDAIIAYIRNHRNDYDRGDIAASDFYKQLLLSMGKAADEGTIAALARCDLESWATLNTDTVKLMDDCKAAGLKVAIASNMPHEFLALARKRFPIFSAVDVGVYSCELGSNKPDKVFYNKLLSGLDLPPSDVVFFDDLQANIDGAAALGVQAILWKDAASAREWLKENGVAL